MNKEKRRSLSHTIVVMFILGTRPEAIKLAPLIMRMKKHALFCPKICVTAQHREMLDQALQAFELQPDYDLDIMKSNQSLFRTTTKILSGLERILKSDRPDAVIVQGDTTSTFAGSLSACYLGIPVYHVEAGLRTFDKFEPFPEELNRTLISRIAELHFAPTINAKNNLIQEGIAEASIIVTGNTAIDAVVDMQKRLRGKRGLAAKCRRRFPFMNDNRKIVLVTIHRRENQGKRLETVCNAIKTIASHHPGIDIVFPVHMNPCISIATRNALKNINNVHLLEPLGYDAFIFLMMQSYLVITDSGGIQEEAPSLGKPVLVLRKKTERTESIDSGTAKIIALSEHSLVREVAGLLENRQMYKNMIAHSNPYGDGRSSDRITQTIVSYYENSHFVHLENLNDEDSASSKSEARTNRRRVTPPSRRAPALC